MFRIRHVGRGRPAQETIVRNKTQILLVDDEPAILAILDRVIHMSLDCETATASNGLEALEAMKDRQFDVVVSDIKMPSMDGVELLKVVRELYPQTVRLAFTGKPGTDIGLRAADSAHQFFTKPLDVQVISEKIDKILRLRKALPEEALEQIVSQVGNLPSMPDVYVQMEEELRQDEVSLDRVTDILARDLAMSAKVLQLVNSAFFGLREEITEISQAVTMLGVDIVKSLALASHVFLEWKDLSGSEFSPNALYDHCLEVAALSQKIAQEQGCDEAAARETYAAGLFHDIGKLIMAANIPESMAEVQRLAAEQEAPRVEVEKRLLGATHAEIGAYLLVLWGLPDNVVNAAAYHHDPGRFETEQGLGTVMAVHVANALVHESYGAADKSGTRVDEEYLEKLGLADRLAAWREL